VEKAGSASQHAKHASAMQAKLQDHQQSITKQIKTPATDTASASHRRHNIDKSRCSPRQAVAHKQLMHLIAIVRPTR
jgi:hypothetical protein